MRTLQAIEERFDFKYPAIYHQLLVDGMLDWGTFGPAWFETEFPKLLAKPPFLLYAPDFELIPIDNIASEIATLRDPDHYMRVDPRFNFVPFGRSGAGDLYCFYLDAQMGDDVPIVLLWHDSDEAQYLAKNIQDFIFASLLSSVVSDAGALIGEGDGLSINAQRMLASHKKYLSPRQLEILSGLFQRASKDAFCEGDDECSSLIAEDEAAVLIADETGFSNLHQSFVYAAPEPVVEITEENRRRVGVLSISVSPIPRPGSPVLEMMRQLNWRSPKPALPDTLSYYRNNSLVFGHPSMKTVDETFRAKLLALREVCPQLVINFKDTDTGIEYLLA